MGGWIVNVTRLVHILDSAQRAVPSSSVAGVVVVAYDAIEASPAWETSLTSSPVLARDACWAMSA